jgi:anti-sigma regulatory factor (Ser/Thr protein kinase)
VYALTVPADAKALAVVSAFVWAICGDAHLSQRKSYQFRLAIDEVVSNIIQHGYQGCEDCPPIRIWAEIQERAVTMTIEDGGEPFDITREMPVVDVSLPLEQRNPGGLGVFLVVRYIDDIRYEYVNGHNINRLTIRRS